MVRERLRVALEATEQDRQPRVVWSRDQQAARRAQHPSDLREPARRVGHMLNHLAGPHEVEGAVLERQGTIERSEQKANLRMGKPRTAQRGLGDVDSDGLRARLRE